MTQVKIAALIRWGVAAPHRDLTTAYLICAAVGAWGLIDIARSMTSRHDAADRDGAPPSRGPRR